jgi:hypothetical protein
MKFYLYTKYVYAVEVSQVTESPVSLNNTHFPPNSNVQIAHLNDANNSPLVLVYHTPEDGKGETVIHVYQLQNHQLGNVSHVQIPLNDGSSIIDGTTNRGWLSFPVAIRKGKFS